MEMLVGWKIIIIIIIILIGILTVGLLIAKKRLKWRYVLAFIFIMIGVFFIKYRIENHKFYEYKDELINQFNYVHDISVQNYGPYSTLTVYLTPDNYSLDKAEPVFVEIMLSLTDETIYSYFKDRHEKKASGEFYFFNVLFREKGNHEEVLFEFESAKELNQFKKWHLEQTDKYYDMADYIDD